MRIIVRPRRDTGGWQVEVPAKLSGSGKRKFKSFSGPDAAARARSWAERLEDAAQLREMGVRSQVTVAQACDQWIAGPWGKALRPSTRRTNESAIKVHVRPAFQGVRLASLDEERMLRFINEKLDAGLSVHHTRTIVGIIQRAAGVVCRRDRLPLPPMGKVGELLTAAAGARELEVSEPVWWNREELDTILELAEAEGGWFSVFVRVAADTGMRRGEVMGLQVGDLNFSDGEIRVRRAIVDGRQVSTKNRKARSVVMVDELAEILRVHLEPSRFAATDPSQWVFPGTNGGHLDIQAVRAPWERLRRRFAAKGVRPFKFHAFRHSWATLAIAAGEPVPWVSAQLGHSTGAFTMRQYAHAAPRQEGSHDWLRRGKPKKRRAARGEGR
jgi:integrase